MKCTCKKHHCWYLEFHDFEGVVAVLMFWPIAAFCFIRGFMWLHQEKMIDGHEGPGPFGIG